MGILGIYQWEKSSNNQVKCSVLINGRIIWVFLKIGYHRTLRVYHFRMVPLNSEPCVYVWGTFEHWESHHHRWKGPNCWWCTIFGDVMIYVWIDFQLYQLFQCYHQDIFAIVCMTHENTGMTAAFETSKTF